jgi:hypothetical protein
MTEDAKAPMAAAREVSHGEGWYIASLSTDSLELLLATWLARTLNEENTAQRADVARVFSSGDGTATVPFDAPTGSHPKAVHTHKTAPARGERLDDSILFLEECDTLFARTFFCPPRRGESRVSLLQFTRQDCEDMMELYTKKGTMMLRRSDWFADAMQQLSVFSDRDTTIGALPLRTRQRLATAWAPIAAAHE